MYKDRECVCWFCCCGSGRDVSHTEKPLPLEPQSLTDSSGSLLLPETFSSNFNLCSRGVKVILSDGGRANLLTASIVDPLGDGREAADKRKDGFI